MSLCKITHQMWHNHPFSQKNKATKRYWGIGLCVYGGGGGGQNLKMGVSNKGGGLYEIKSIRIPLPTMKTILKCYEQLLMIVGGKPSGRIARLMSNCL